MCIRRFSAKLLPPGHSIYAHGYDVNTTATLCESGLWYAANAPTYAEEALLRVSNDPARGDGWMIIACQSTLGPLYTSCSRPITREEASEGDVKGVLWECAPHPEANGGATRTRVRYFAVADTAREDHVRAVLCRAIVATFGDEPVFETVTFCDGSTTAIVALNVVLPDIYAVHSFTRIAFAGETASQPRHADRIPMQARPLITAAAHDVTREGWQPDAAPVAQAAEIGRWHEIDMNSGSAELEAVAEADLPSLVMKHVVPQSRLLPQWKLVLTAVAKSLMVVAGVDAGDEEKSQRDFETWATRDGYLMGVTPFEVSKIWDEAKADLAVEMGQGNGVYRLSVCRDMIDIMRGYAPQVYTAFVETTGRSLTHPKTTASQQPPRWMEYKYELKEPGPDAIGDLSELMRSYKYVLLGGPPGLGKTSACKTTLAVSSVDTIPSALIVTTRVSVADAVAKEYEGFTHYRKDCQSTEDRTHADFLICELESLMTLLRSYALIILDEFLTILLQTLASINRSRFNFLVNKIEQLCRNAKNVIICDALLPMDIAARFIAAVEGPEPPDQGTAIYLDFRPPPRPPAERPRIVVKRRLGDFTTQDIDQAIGERAQAGHRRLFVFTNVKKLSGAIKDSFVKVWGDCADNPRILQLNKDTWGKFATRLNDPNNTIDSLWAQYDLIVVTPVVSNAISFNVRDHFDAVLLFCSNRSCLPQDAFQGSRRPRFPRCPTIYAYVASACSQGGHGGRASAIENYDALEREAALRYTRATSLQRLCYRVARRASLFSFHFYPHYLGLCFEAAGYEVVMSGERLTGKGKIKAERVEGDMPLSFQETPAVSEQRYEPESCIKGAMKRLRENLLTEKEAQSALQFSGVSCDDGSDPIRLLINVDRRHRFARQLLAIEQDEPGGQAVVCLADQAETKTLHRLYADFCAAEEHPYWKARKAIMFQRWRERAEPDIRFESRFSESAAVCFGKQYDTVLDLATTLGTPLTPDCPASATPREALERAWPKIGGLANGFNAFFSPKDPFRVTATAAGPKEKALQAAQVADLARRIFTSWNPLLEFRKVSSGKRKRSGPGGSGGDAAPYVLKWNSDSNDFKQMDFFLARVNDS